MPGVVPVAFSWSDPATWVDAASDIDAVYVVRPDRADAPDLVADLLSRTPEHTHVVLLSERDVEYFAASDWAPRCERAGLDRCARHRGRGRACSARPGHAGRTYDLSGPQALTLAETAELLSTGVGRTVTHIEKSIEEAAAGLEGVDRDLTVVTFERVRAGVFATVTDTVERVTGRPARSLGAFVSDLGPFRT